MLKATHPYIEVQLRAHLPRALFDGLTALGHDPASIARDAGIPALALESGMTAVEADRFLCAAYEKVNNPALGLLVAQHLKPERLSTSALAAMVSPTLAVALQRMARYNRLTWGDDYEVTLDAQALVLSVLTPQESRPYGYSKVDMELASITELARLFTGVHVQPLSLSLRQPEPAYAALYAKTFGCPVRFGQARNTSVFSAEDAHRPLCSANPAVATALAAVAESAVRPLEEANLVAHIHVHLAQVLHDGKPSLQTCAAALAMHQRTLQRRLTQLGTRFAQVLDAYRHQSALLHLQQRAIDGHEMAFLLGFADSSSYFRAFKRWTQTTPEQYRHALSSTAGGPNAG